MSRAIVGQVLDGVLDTHAAPRFITVDHGKGFQCQSVKAWACWCDVQLEFIGVGKPAE